VVLRSFPPDLGLGSLQGRFAGADDTFDLLQVRAGAELTGSPPGPTGWSPSSGSARPRRPEPAGWS
jgi:hypothetical protein